MTTRLSIDDVPKQEREAHQQSARHRLWRMGDLRYLLHHGREPSDPVVERYVPQKIRPTERRGQLQALEAVQRAITNSADTFVVKTGRQYGKSLFFVVFCAMLCLRSVLDDTEPLRIPYAAPSGKQVDEFITPHFQLLQDHAPKDLAPEYKAKSGSWVFSNGSRIVVAGCEDTAKADRLRGPKAHAAVVDEAGFIPIVDYVIESVLGWQLATTGGLMLVSSTPPISLDHAFVGLWEKAKSDGYAFEATTPEAPHMSPELIDKAIARCGGETTVAWKREGLGQLIVDPASAVLPEFGESSTVLEARELPDHYMPAVVGDGGFIDQSVFAFGYYDFRDALYVIEDELVFRRTRSDEQGIAIEAKAAYLWPGCEVDRRRVDAPPQVRADMNRPEWGPELEEGQPTPHWLPVTKPVGKGGVGSMERGVNEVRILLAQDRIRIHPRCKTIIDHSTNARWDSARKQFVRVRDSRKEPLHHYDGAAALVYFIRDVDTHSNPYPQIPEGAGLPSHFIREHRLQKSEHEKIRGFFKRGK